MNLKKKFLTVYDYGTGGIWVFIAAESREAIAEKFPSLKIYDYEDPPAWMEQQRFQEIEARGVVDIDGPYNEFLTKLAQDKA